MFLYASTFYRNTDCDVDPNFTRFYHRLSHILTQLVAVALALSFEDYRHEHVNEPKAILFIWFLFLRRFSLEQSSKWLLAIYVAGIPKHVQFVLGQERFGLVDLQALPSRWKTNDWGVYLDIVTKSTDVSWHRFYVGSSVDKGRTAIKCLTGGGLWKRIGGYFAWVRRSRTDDAGIARIKRIGGAHGKAVMEEGACIYPIILAKFARTVPKVYVHLLETMMMLFLQTYQRQELGYVSIWSPSVCYDAAETCLPSDLDQVDKHIGLNRAWPLLQATSGDTSEARACCHCKSTDTRSWYHLDPAQPYMAMLCRRCFRWRSRHGTMRPPHLDRIRMNHKNNTHICDACKYDITTSNKLAFWRASNQLLCQSCFAHRTLHNFDRVLLPGSRKTDTAATKNIEMTGERWPHCVACGTSGMRMSWQASDKKPRCKPCDVSMAQALSGFARRNGAPPAKKRLDYPMSVEAIWQRGTRWEREQTALAQSAN